jgi:small redox-active disulfide protein 2
MKVQILGMGCPKCKKLFETAEMAVKDSGVDAEIEKIADLDRIMGFGVMMTPALAIDGEVKSSGRLPTKKEIEGWIRK